tara:strand:+ start:2879 stop:3052 length:174 start_codon:yes stop_codon:yes gene_type:complete
MKPEKTLEQIIQNLDATESEIQYILRVVDEAEKNGYMLNSIILSELATLATTEGAPD